MARTRLMKALGRKKSDGTVNPPKQTGLGTFDGVFTPSLLTILGVIMYLRFGWVVGQAGLGGTLLIVTLATTITFLTALSISAIATDQVVRAGGAYFMISRSLGIEAGGAVGIPLYLAQALSVALYTVGFAESLSRSFPGIDQRWAGIITTVLVAVLAIKSAKLAIRSQYIVMAAIGISLVALFAGGSPEPSTHAAVAAQSFEPVPFWQVFAVFFPAVTGIMAGVNLSGDLKDPAKSIPKGTLAAVGSGYLIYMLIPVILALRATSEELVSDPLIMRRMSLWGDSILLGVWGATLSSAIGSILGAPRVLQALVRDDILPGSLKFLGKGTGDTDEPRNGTIFTLGLALMAVWMGDLDLIAPVLTMFFLTTYGVLNITAGLERFLDNPSFRPTFQIHWIWSLLGTFGCIAVMFLINAVATFVAIVIVASIYVWLQRRELESAWGDVRSGIWMALMRASLLRMNNDPDPKNWRPHLLVLSGAPSNRWHLVDLASSFTHNRALLTVASVVTAENVTPERIRSFEASLSEFLDKLNIQSLVRVIGAPDPFTGIERLVDTYGIGSLVPNTILLGQSENPDNLDPYCRAIRHIYQSQRNTLILRYSGTKGFGDRKKIDLWWGGLRKNGGLMKILAYLLQSSDSWRDADVRLKIVVPTKSDVAVAHQNLSRLIQQARTDAIPDVIPANGRPFSSILHESSSDADLIIMGMAPPSDGFETYYRELQESVSGLPSILYVLAQENLAFQEMIVQADHEQR